jgi:hypothetical protein
VISAGCYPGQKMSSRQDSRRKATSSRASGTRKIIAPKARASALRCPYESQISSSHQWVERENLAWLGRVGLLPDRLADARARRSMFGVLAGVPDG